MERAGRLLQNIGCALAGVFWYVSDSRRDGAYYIELVVSVMKNQNNDWYYYFEIKGQES